MPETLLERYLSTVSLTWLNYVTLAIAIFVICGGAFVCVHCSPVVNFVLVCLNALKEILILPPSVEYMPAERELAINHHILSVRPEYGVDISKVISDIIDVLNQAPLEYPTPEKPKKYRTRPHKVDVRGWRHTLNERWKKKMKFMRVKLLQLGIKEKHKKYQDKMIESLSLNTRICQSEEFILLPVSDHDDDVIVCEDKLTRKITLFKATADGIHIPHYE